MSEKPRVSLVLTCYNQERYIRAALQGAFAQTYENLEIVLCDDCSTDATVKIIEEMISSYQRVGGKHQVRFCVNEKNLGCAKNYEKAMLLSTGELLVTGGGDDISYPNRVERIVYHWLAQGKKPTLLWHGARIVDENDREIPFKFSGCSLRHPLGAVIAYSSCVVKEFPSIVYENSFEDSIFARRAALFGDFHEIDEVLIDYRQGSGVSTSRGLRKRRMRIARAMRDGALQGLLDLESVQDKVLPTRAVEVKSVCEAVANDYANELEYLGVMGGGFIERVRVTCHRVRTQKSGVRDLICYYLPMIFPFLECPIVWFRCKLAQVKRSRRKVMAR